MAGRPLMLATLLGASIGVPYVVSQSNQSPNPAGSPPATGGSSWSNLWQGADKPVAPPPLLSAQPSPANSSFASTFPQSYPTTSTPAPLTGLENLRSAEAVNYHSIQQVLRFDVTREWVYQNWDRKSTGLGDPELFGIRVVLLTGTQRTDLAGALTYLFNAQGQCEHISFRGRTADTTQLVQFLTQHYHFQRMEGLAGEQLYQVRSGSSVFSELRTRPESVLVETSPNSSIGVVLELGRPGSNRPLQPPVPHLNIPVVESSTPAADVAAEAAKDGSAKDPALIGKLRPATQIEHNQALGRRWPN